MAMTNEEKEQKIQKYMQENNVSYKKAALKIYLQRLKVKDPEAYEKMKKVRDEYQKKWRARNPAYNRKWSNKYYKKHPEKQKEYQRRCWLKKL